MTVFEEAYNKVIAGSEGGYANDPTDKGGETYAGISRKFHPDWEGWKIVSEVKSQESEVSRINARLKADERVGILIKEFYKKEFWDMYAGDSLNPFVSAELFDQAVNFGVGKAIEHLQRAINLLNRNAKDYPDVPVDGGFGKKTFEGYKNCVAHNSVNHLCNLLNGFQMKRYIEIMEADHSQEKYAGWFSRVIIDKW